MTEITIEEAQVKLLELIDGLSVGEGVVITRDARPVAQLIGLAVQKPHPVPGRGIGKFVILAEDDEHLKDFQDYMP